MDIYLQAGLHYDDYKYNDDTGSFYIVGNAISSDIYNYEYPKDFINYDLDGALVELYDTLRDLYFEDTDRYHLEFSMLPQFALSAGYDSDCAISVDTYNQFITDKSISGFPNLNKHLYLQDCQAMVSTIQNLLSGMEDCFINYFTIIPDINRSGSELLENGVFFCSSAKVRALSSYLESYFTKAYSILDIMCKILFECQYVQDDFTKYQKLKSANRLWGDRKKLALDDFSDTVFDPCTIISTIEALRNEVVHNGSWEQNPKVFLKAEEGRIIERFMLFPDISQGRLCSSKNRKHFFSMGTKVNNVLPDIHSGFKERLLRTIEQINEKYPLGK